MTSAGRLQRQRGAIGVMTAFLLVWLVALVTLALDAGRLYLEQRRLQQAADLAAVSAAASCQALFQGDACGHASLRQWAIDAVQENGIDVDAGDATLTLTQGAVDDGGRFITESGLANSVEVRLQREVPSSLLANLGELIGGEVDDNTRLTATGVARRASMVTLSAGTSLLEVDTSESAVLALLLDRLVGARLDLTVLGAYDGVGLELSLGELLGVESLDVDLEEQLAQSLDLEALGQRIREALDSVGANPVRPGAPGERFTLAELLAIDPQGEVAVRDILTARVPVRELLEGALLLDASKQGGVRLGLADLSSIAVGLGLADLSLALEVISPPTIAVGPPGPAGASLASDCSSSCYPSVARNAQLELSLELGLGVAGLLNVEVSTRVTGAEGRAAVDAMAALDDGLELSVVAQRSLVQIEQEVRLLGLFSNDEEATAGSAQGAKEQRRLGWPDQSRAVFDGQGGAQVTQVLNGLVTSVVNQLGLLGGLVSTLGVPSLLSATLSDVNTALLEPALEGLGIGVNTLDVRVLAVDAGGVESLTGCATSWAGCQDGESP
ncbi:pilus assembly protein TadG-related protein [Halomonas litopenaei]|uniref:pilus assembly protein TadG-related protein n=1 Tax=Halomonas litopenaei TaxID=2109328 RepID=UPI001A9050E4|nr:pilus assembly protein TadG-related protein [Halomonas litopenaei]MBN8411982.1 hypothetical protein [Halomonas litopenaei]